MSDRTLIYVIRHEHGFVKIGKSNEPRQRLKSLQTACPYDLEIFTAITAIGDWHVIEQAIHDAYAEYRVGGEWFDLPEREVVALDDVSRVKDTTVEQIAEWTPEKHIRFKQEQNLSLIMRGNFDVE